MSSVRRWTLPRPNCTQGKLISAAPAPHLSKRIQLFRNRLTFPKSLLWDMNSGVFQVCDATAVTRTASQRSGASRLIVTHKFGLVFSPVYGTCRGAV